MAVLEEIEGLLARTAASHGPAVLGIGRGWGTGSGVVIAPGRVLTTARLLRHDEVAVTLPGGERREGSVTASDSQFDLALIAVDTGGATPFEWAVDDPAPGQAVIALANPGGRGLRVTLGFISAVGRGFRGPRGRRIAGAIEHTAPLPRGSSGGPLLDTSGRLLGLNSVRAEGGLILALHGDSSVRERVGALVRGEAPRPARLGVAVAPPRVSRELRDAVGLGGEDGLLVRGVQDDSPAAHAGVRRGDLIVRIGERETPRIEALHEALDAAPRGEATELAVVRGSEPLVLSVRL